MSVRIPAELRRQVVDRAEGYCEYCGIHQAVVLSSHQIDHVIAEKHQGQTTFENLALSCMTCNLRKASDIASFDPETGVLSLLFNPRTQSWIEHFAIDGPKLVGLTTAGRTTIEFLQLNSFERLAERVELMKVGAYRWSTIR